MGAAWGREGPDPLLTLPSQDGSHPLLSKTPFSMPFKKCRFIFKLYGINYYMDISYTL